MKNNNAIVIFYKGIKPQEGDIIKLSKAILGGNLCEPEDLIIKTYDDSSLSDLLIKNMVVDTTNKVLCQKTNSFSIVEAISFIGNTYKDILKRHDYDMFIKTIMDDLSLNNQSSECLKKSIKKISDPSLSIRIPSSILKKYHINDKIINIINIIATLRDVSQ